MSACLFCGDPECGTWQGTRATSRDQAYADAMGRIHARRPWHEALAALSPCSDALRWARGYATLAEAWAACERGDWMLWLAGRCAGAPGSDLRRPLVLAACDCADLVLARVPDGVDAPAAAIGIARQWALGDESISLDDVRAAASAAYTASAAYATAASAAYAAADASTASTAYATADAATYAATYAAYAAADAAAYAAADADAYAGTHGAAQLRTLDRCADIVRSHYPAPPVLPPLVKKDVDTPSTVG